MDPNDRDKLNRIEELKSKLFSKNYRTKIEHREGFSKEDIDPVRESWDEEYVTADSGSSKLFFMKTSIFKNFFFLAVAFFLGTLIYAGYMFFGGSNTVSNDNIDISIIGNNFVAGGEDLSFIVEIKNKNSSSLDLVDMIVEYPKSSKATDPNLSMERSRVSIGSIPSGTTHDENVKLVLFGEQGATRSIKVSIEYRVPGSNSIFVKEKAYDVTISSSPINIGVDAPTSISPNQDIPLNIKVSLNSTKPAQNILLKVDYPLGFVFTSADPAPVSGNNVWNLGDIPPGGEKDIAVVGKMQDVFDGEKKAFQIFAGTQSSTVKYAFDDIFNSFTHVVDISKPYIDARIFINGVNDHQYASSSKTQIGGRIDWTNNLDTKVNDLVITAKLSGNSINRKSIIADQGFYNSATDTITWDRNSISKFKEVNPSDSGSVSFSFNPLPLFSASTGVVNSPTINIEVSVSGKQISENYATKDLNNLTSASIRLISDVGFVNKILYYSGAFTNHGTIPPKVEKETTYTVVWELSNTSNSISKGVITSSLPTWSRFVGTISPAGEDLTFNPLTRAIVWNLGSIPKGAGVSGPARSVSFQVALSPSLSQLGSSPTLIGEASLTGHDDFANLDVKVNKGSLNTTLGSDPSFPPNGGTVTE